VILGVSISSGAILILIIAWRCTLLPSILKPKVRRKKKEDLRNTDIQDVIEQGPVNPAEDLDPSLEVNPIQKHMIEQARKKAAKEKEDARKQKAAGGTGGGGTSPRKGRRGSALTMLGIKISFRQDSKQDVTSTAANPGIAEVDVQIRKEADLARQKEAQRAAAMHAASQGDAQYRQAEAAALEASQLAKGSKRPGRFSLFGASKEPVKGTATDGAAPAASKGIELMRSASDAPA